MAKFRASDREVELVKSLESAWSMTLEPAGIEAIVQRVPVQPALVKRSPGAMAGFFVVPMNALLQHRGHVMLSAGHSIAVQNFNENISILVMLALYSLMIMLDFRINTIIVMFGMFVAGTMYMVMRWNAANHRANPNLDRMIGEAKH